MLRTRVIPALLLRRGGLVKTVRFKHPQYVGDPINAVRIFNEKEVDELVFLDIGATVAGAGPNFDLLEQIATEAFMPFGYGGGISSADQAERLFALGVEKVVLNSAAVEQPQLVERIARAAGSSSVVAGIDVKRHLVGGYRVYTRSATKAIGQDPVTCARVMEDHGAGEILLQSVDRDGTRSGYDLDLIRRVSAAVSIPVVACGGAGELAHLREASAAGASAVAAGSLFVFHGRHRAVLITYPDYDELTQVLEP